MDCIAAISTPLAAGGVSMIRISGEDALTVAKKVFLPKYPHTDISQMDGYTACYGDITDKSGKKLDDGVLLVFKAPHSYTGENTAEITCHGGVRISKLVLRSVLDAGARMATAGEFTRQALLSGKLSLTEAESVIDLINAGSDGLIACARAQADGSLYRRIEKICGDILSITSEITVWIDYPDESEDEDEINRESWLKRTEEVKRELDSLLATYDTGKVLSDGIAAAIVGKPNAGKSTLMNLLSGEEKSIVTDIEGTTRDIVEQTVNIGDIMLRLSDCAGIRETADAVENIGVSKMLERIESSQLIIAVFDGSRQLSDEDRRLISVIEGKTVLPVVNKSDLETAVDLSYIEERLGKAMIISAKQGIGTDALQTEIEQRCHLKRLSPDSGFLANERQRQCALGAASSVNNAYDALSRGMTADVAGLELELALSHLYELSGKSASEEVIDSIFSRFCVGK